MATDRARAKHVREGGVKARSISDLQRDAPEIIREAAESGEIEIRRYGTTVAYLMSPEERQRLLEAEHTLNRTIWAFDLNRAMDDWNAGRVVEWEEAAARLRALFTEK